MTLRATSCVLLLLIGAGCGDAVTPEPPVEPAPEAAADAPAEPAATDESAEQDQPVLPLEAVVGEPVRGRLRYYSMWTYPEVCVREVVPATAETPAQVRFTLRLCTEDGRTEARAMRWSKKTGWKVLLTDAIFETTVGGTRHVFFECPYGTAWEVDVTADGVESDRVRLSIRGEWRACTK